PPGPAGRPGHPHDLRRVRGVRAGGPRAPGGPRRRPQPPDRRRAGAGAGRPLRGLRGRRTGVVTATTRGGGEPDPDLLVLGSGVAGLSVALEAARVGLHAVILTKADVAY